MTNQIAVGMKSGRREVGTAELIVIRHGATASPGTLNGRTDVGLATRPAPLAFDPGVLWTSPARRARETVAGLFPGREAQEDVRLWEQDFGVWDGVAYSDLPDTGDLSLEALAALKADGGESHIEMAARVRPVLEAASGLALTEDTRVTIVAHAGTVRAALALATGSEAAGLAFQIAHLGATRFRCYPGGLAVLSVNEVLA